MNKQPALTWTLSILGAAAIGGGVWFLLRRGKGDDIVGRIETYADNAREKTGGLARTLKEKATPLIQTIGEVVEKNAEIVSAIAKIDAEQVRRTGQEIKQAAAVLDKNLDALSNI